MHEKIIKYLKTYPEHDIDYLRAYLIKLGFHSDEVDDAIEEYEDLRNYEEEIPIFPDPPKDLNQN
jgi:uncharacterized protein Smg (DUF494 family)